jgi:integrase
MAGRRRFGRVRQLPSGRWQVRYRGPDDLDRPAPETFARKRDAESWLVRKEAEILAGDWVDPAGGQVPFREFATSWVTERPNLRPRTLDLYSYLLRQHLLPTFGRRSVGDIREPQIRTWRRRLLDSDVSPVTVAKAYRLLKAILNTAVDDGLIRRNPCRIVGGGQERSAERTVLAVDEVFRLARAIDGRYQALVLLGTFGSLRWGELAALTRCRVDLEACAVEVVASLTETDQGRLSLGPPKSAAGRRSVQLPPLIVPALREHLERYAQPGADGLVFVGPNGARLRRSNFRRRVWLPALAKAGLPEIHFHDLRHTGNNLTATAGASLRELMTRMGHSSTRAALVYLHDTDLRQHALATAVSELAQDQLGQGSSGHEGTAPETGTGT